MDSKLEDQKSVIKVLSFRGWKTLPSFSMIGADFFFVVVFFFFLKPANPYQPFITRFHTLKRAGRA